MRRDHFTLTATDLDPQSTGEPTLEIDYEGPAGNLTARLADEGGLPDAEEIDAAFRLQDPIDADEASGVFSLTRRLTGEFLLEANTTAAEIYDLVEAACEADGDYRIRIERPSGEAVLFLKETLLVYDEEGNLLRGNSLIPGGVEL
jgi:hypothetical protein